MSLPRKTPWTKPQSSFPSDRLNPQYRTQSGQSQSRSKGSSPQPTIPKSKAVLELESLVNGLSKEKARKDKKGGCFCQAREHDLSEYNPLCRSCGLVLCSLNLPYNLCPSCSASLLPPHAMSSLITKLQSRIAEQLAKEEHERVVEAERIRQAIGAFPTLTGAPPTSLPHTLPEPQTHKVISLNSKSRTVKVKSYSPVASQPQTPSEPLSVRDDDEKIRMPCPPEGVSYARVDWDPKRPWADLREGAQRLRYIPLPKAPRPLQTSGEDGGGKSKRGKNKGTKGKVASSVDQSSTAVPGSSSHNR